MNQVEYFSLKLTSDYFMRITSVSKQRLYNVYQNVMDVDLTLAQRCHSVPYLLIFV